MPRTFNAPPLTPYQAQYVLQRLLQEGRINGSDLRRAIDGMHREIGELEQKLQDLRAASGGAGGARTARAATAGGRTRQRSTRAVTPQVMASRKLQGQYIGYMRQLPQKERGKYAEMAKSKGREAAITAMKRTLGK